jgi:hypothetical protein
MSLLARRVLLLPIAALLVSACVSGAASSGSNASPTPRATASSTPSSSTTGFSLLLWQSNGSISPESYLPGSLPQAAIADGLFITGMVAVPAIYPGPLYISPLGMSLSVAGQQAVVSALRQAGLLANLDFATPPMPGVSLLHLRVSLDGITYETVGNPPVNYCDSTTSICTYSPGSAAAFADMVSRLSMPESWLSGYMGSASQYDPDRLVVRLMAPQEAAGPMTPVVSPWPLASSFAQISATGNFDCVTLTSTDTGALLPVILRANVLARFSDVTGAVKSIQARALLPGEDPPCPVLVEK